MGLNFSLDLCVGGGGGAVNLYGGELKLYGGNNITTISLFHFFRNSQNPEK